MVLLSIVVTALAAALALQGNKISKLSLMIDDMYHQQLRDKQAVVRKLLDHKKDMERKFIQVEVGMCGIEERLMRPTIKQLQRKGKGGKRGRR